MSGAWEVPLLPIDTKPFEQMLNDVAPGKLPVVNVCVTSASSPSGSETGVAIEPMGSRAPMLLTTR